MLAEAVEADLCVCVFICVFVYVYVYVRACVCVCVCVEMTGARGSEREAVVDRERRRGSRRINTEEAFEKRKRKDQKQLEQD